ncbi:helix-turn-helix domain-containing protein [Burkholderia catarinensis]|uniref:helix-turn-helix domain-containing protein n=1 Tax=Burkholderia catarinensis TaxID=1108140 RepID=UPI001FE78640|nr:helix-turn-helix domain-containing protein [Burkholderia catarinensis]
MHPLPSRAGLILAALGDCREIGISERSQQLGMSKTTVHRFLQALKALGYVAQEDGLPCLAVPMFDRFDRVVAGLSLSFPTMRCDTDTKAHYVVLLTEAGQAISARLGHRPEAAGVEPAPVVQD